jgi:GNAT superfamily N-acetyltransferase
VSEFFQDSSTTALVNVIDANLIEKSLRFPRLLGGKIHGPNPLWFETGAAMPGNNGVVRATFAPGEIDRGIETILRPFRARSMPLTWWVGPTTAPGDLGKHLQEHGFTHDRDMIGMAMDVRELHEPASPALELTVERVRDEKTLAQWYDVLLTGFPISYNRKFLDLMATISLDTDEGWHHYVGRVDGEIVTISSLILGAGVAGLYNLTTLPHARGRGIGALMTVKTFHAARDVGYRVGTLQTTYPNALRMYHRLGFEVYCKIGIYRYVVPSRFVDLG